MIHLNEIGDRDCMDWTDEYFNNYGKYCPFQAKPIDCDEHLCYMKMYSCGDGQCIRWESRMAFQRKDPVADCLNKRNLNNMCEFSQSSPSLNPEHSLTILARIVQDPDLIRSCQVSLKILLQFLLFSFSQDLVKFSLGSCLKSLNLPCYRI